MVGEINWTIFLYNRFKKLILKHENVILKDEEIFRWSPVGSDRKIIISSWDSFSPRFFYFRDPSKEFLWESLFEFLLFVVLLIGKVLFYIEKSL